VRRHPLSSVPIAPPQVGLLLGRVALDFIASTPCGSDEPDEDYPMKIAIVGAGAIGGWLGTGLAAQRQEVSALARGSTLARASLISLA